MRDLDFGRQIIAYLQQLEWPEGVVVEDLSCSAPLVLHRLQELRPAKVVLVGAVARDLDPPATLRRYQVDLTPLDSTRVHRSVEESVMGLVDIDHTLVMARHWGGLPVDTVVIEVEPAEVSFGLGFSEELGGCLDTIVEKLRQELVDMADAAGPAPDITADHAAVENAAVDDVPSTMLPSTMEPNRASRSTASPRTGGPTPRLDSGFTEHPPWSTPLSRPFRACSSLPMCVRGAPSSTAGATGSTCFLSTRARSALSSGASPAEVSKRQGP